MLMIRDLVVLGVAVALTLGILVSLLAIGVIR